MKAGDKVKIKQDAPNGHGGKEGRIADMGNDGSCVVVLIEDLVHGNIHVPGETTGWMSQQWCEVVKP